MVGGEPCVANAYKSCEINHLKTNKLISHILAHSNIVSINFPCFPFLKIERMPGANLIRIDL